MSALTGVAPQSLFALDPLTYSTFLDAALYVEEMRSSGRQ